MQLRYRTALLSAGMVTLLGGCDANQLYMGSRTVVGVNAAVNVEQNNGWVVVGYDRTFATLIPRSVDKDPEPGKPAKQDAMTSLACSSLGVSGVTVKYFESIATGEAAEKFAKALKEEKDTKPVKDFFECFKNKDSLRPRQPLTGGV